MAKKTEEKNSKSKTSLSNNSILKKTWRNVPVVLIGVVGLLVIISVATAVFLNTDSNTTDDAADNTDHYSEYSEEEREAIEQSQLPDNVEASTQLQSEGKVEESYAIWEDQIAATTDPDQTAEATFQLGLAQINAGNVAGAIDTLKSIEDLGSGFDLFLLYSTLGRAAASTGDKANAVTYIELTIQNIAPDNYEYDWEYEIDIADYNELLQEVKAL